MASQVPPADPSIDPLSAIVALIAELPTENAVRELNKGKVGGSVRRVVETMAVHKMDIVGAVAALARRENLAMKLLEMHYKIADLEKIDWSTVEITFHERQKD